jgi:hypothetical protein
LNTKLYVVRNVPASVPEETGEIVGIEAVNIVGLFSVANSL